MAKMGELFAELMGVSPQIYKQHQQEIDEASTSKSGAAGLQTGLDRRSERLSRSLSHQDSRDQTRLEGLISEMTDVTEQREDVSARQGAQRLNTPLPGSGRSADSGPELG